jgi:hypothetical protein
MNENDSNPPGKMLPLGDIGGAAKHLFELLFGSRYVRRMGEAKAKAIPLEARANAEAAIVGARAKVVADLIAEDGRQMLSALQARGVERELHEVEFYQRNLESIAIGAVPSLKENAAPQNISPDWLAAFSQKSRLVSDEQLQQIWSRILASEANTAGSVSKRTLSLLADMDKSDAEAFTKLCAFVIRITSCHTETKAFLSRSEVLVLNYNDEIYRGNGAGWSDILHLASIGLCIVEPQGMSIALRGVGEVKSIIYMQNTSLGLGQEAAHKEMWLGQCSFTKAGEQLAPLCRPDAVPSFPDYIISKASVIFPHKWMGAASE